MTIQQLHYAIVIAEAGSLNKAAERLYVSQPSLTNAMQELEKELNITIFHRLLRTRRGMCSSCLPFRNWAWPTALTSSCRIAPVRGMIV